MLYKADAVVSFSCSFYKQPVEVAIFDDPACVVLYERLNVFVWEVEPYDKIIKLKNNQIKKLIRFSKYSFYRIT